MENGNTELIKKILIIRSAPIELLYEAVDALKKSYGQIEIDILTNEAMRQKLASSGYKEIRNIYTYDSSTITINNVSKRLIGLMKKNSYELVVVLEFEPSHHPYLNVFKVAFKISKNIKVYQNGSGLKEFSYQDFGCEKIKRLLNCISLITVLPLYIKYLFMKKGMKEGS